jgi:uncharacterized membrane protein
MKIITLRGVDLVAGATWLAGCAFTAFVYGRLPETIATHFDVNGEPNGFMSRLGAALFSPILAAFVWLFMRLVPALAPLSKVAVPNHKLSMERVTAPLAAAQVVFVTLVHGTLLVRALHETFPAVRAVLFGVGVLLAVTGLLLPRTSRNAWLGVRNAWTLTSDEVWSRTHRFAGQLFVVSGLVSGASALTARTGVASAVIIASVVVSAAASTAYAWWTHRGLSA